VQVKMKLRTTNRNMPIMHAVMHDISNTLPLALNVKVTFPEEVKTENNKKHNSVSASIQVLMKSNLIRNHSNA
jgi:hypothetical protein